MPVTLTSFEVASASNQTALLKWATASEENNKEFIVEKSNDGVDFIVIGSVPAGNSHGQEYTFTDENVEGNSNYYRLKQVDIDGHFSYSSIQLLSRTIQSILSVSPTHIITDLERSQKIYYQLSTSTGQNIEEGSYEASSGIMEKQLSNHKLPNGIYVIHVVSQDINFSKKLIIQD